MKRLLQSIILIILAIPAFSGLFLNAGPTAFFDISVGRLLYLLVTTTAILILQGRFLWLTATIIALLVAIPVVLGGSIVALILYAMNLGGMTLPQIAAHYVALFINMLSMIPLAIALVSLIPTAALETRLLRDTAGVTSLQKKLLMAMRVFNHAVFAVMPEIIQAATEELRFNGYLYKAQNKIKHKRRLFLKSVLQIFMFMAITAICSVLKYIHFWTAEISALAGKKESRDQDISALFKTGVIAAFIALAFLGTFLVKIPIPATGGYFNLGDTFVMLAGLFFGPLAGLLTGLIGPAIADLIGFPQFVPATAVTKGLEGFWVGLLAYRSLKINRPIIAVSTGVFILVAGYFIFEAFIYPFIGQTIPFFAVTDIRAAVLEALPNFIQGMVSAALSVIIWRLFKGKSNK